MFRVCFILLFALLSSCGQNDSKIQSEELASYISELKSDYTEITGEPLDTDISIQIKDLGGNLRGSCRQKRGTFQSSKEVFINRETFEINKEKPEIIKVILLHEIGHCVYGFDHDDTHTDLGGAQAPRSVMYPRTLHVTEQFRLNADMKEYYYLEFSRKVKDRSELF